MVLPVGMQLPEKFYFRQDNTDVGRCTADIDPTQPGVEMWSVVISEE